MKEVRLCEEIQDNTAYRRFYGLGLTEKIPNHATISVNRKRRFRNNDIAEQIFQEILHQAQEKGLVGGKILYTDSTHVKALARSLYAWRKQTIERSFADAEHLHGFRYGRMRGNANMREQAFLTAAVQNMEKMASLLWKLLLRLFHFTTPILYPICQSPHLD